LLAPDPLDPELVVEIESWQAAASEALVKFEALLDDPVQ
jgi:hypothetical protein